MVFDSCVILSQAKSMQPASRSKQISKVNDRTQLKFCLSKLKEGLLAIGVKSDLQFFSKFNARRTNVKTTLNGEHGCYQISSRNAELIRRAAIIRRLNMTPSQLRSIESALGRAVEVAGNLAK